MERTEEISISALCSAAWLYQRYRPILH